MKRNRLIKISISSAIIIVAAVYVTVALLAPLPTLKPQRVIAASKSTGTAAPQVGWSGYGEQAIGAVGYGVISSNGKNAPLPIASVAKVMAALAVLQKKPLAAGQNGPTITLTAADVAIYNADNNDNQSIVPVAVGEQITEYQALEAMLIPSATNLATSLTNWAFGSQAAYVSFANSYAKTLGMTQSNFADASGYSPQTVSTPSDLVILGGAAIQNPVIKTIVNQKSVTLPVAGTVANFNIDIGIDGINGIKTGNTDQAGGALLYSARYNGLDIIGVTLGAPDLGTALHDAPEILNSFKTNVTANSVIKAGETIAVYEQPWGGERKAAAVKQLPITDFQSSSLPLTVSLHVLPPAQYRQSDVGTVSFEYHGQTFSSPVTLDGTISRPGVMWRLLHP